MSDTLNGVEKTALFLAMVGEELAARIMESFDADERMRIGKTMLSLESREIPEDTVRAVLAEFQESIGSKGLKGELERTLDGVMGRLYGAEEGANALERIREAAGTENPFRGLFSVRGSELARILSEEHPQIQAIVLTNLEPDHAAAVLEALPAELRPDVVTRMATMEDPPARTLKRVAQSLIERAQDLRRDDALEPGARYRAVAGVLNATAPGTDKEILKVVEQQDEDLGSRIRDWMFTWSDMQLVDKRTMQKILAGVDTKVLALSLKASDEAVTEAILSSTSQRTRDMIQEERELLGAVPLTEVLEAQRQILFTVRDLMDSGEIAVSKGKSATYAS